MVGPSGEMSEECFLNFTSEAKTPFTFVAIGALLHWQFNTATLEDFIDRTQVKSAEKKLGTKVEVPITNVNVLAF